MIKSHSTEKNTRSHIDFSNALQMNVIMILNKTKNESRADVTAPIYSRSLSIVPNIINVSLKHAARIL